MTDNDQAPAPTPDTPEADPARLSLRERLWPLRRDAFRPHVSGLDAGPGPRWGSRFGGLPCLSLTNTWPQCGECGLPLTFLLQLDLATVPAPCTWADADGLVQLFFCTRCAPVGPDSTGIALRLLPVQHWTIPGVAPAGTEILPERHVLGWHGPHDDLPVEGDPDASLLGEDAQTARALNLVGDKQGGWPHWLQDPEYPVSPRSGQRLDRLLLQLDTTADHLPISLGDSGIGYIFQSPDDPSDLAFLWQCL
jgi:hypothetical protein